MVTFLKNLKGDISICLQHKQQNIRHMNYYFVLFQNGSFTCTPSQIQTEKIPKNNPDSLLLRKGSPDTKQPRKNWSRIMNAKRHIITQESFSEEL